MGLWTPATDGALPTIVTAKISDAYSADQIIHTGTCVFYGIIFKTDGTNDITFTVWDGLVTGTTQLTPDDIIIPAARNYDSIGYPLPIECSTGIFVEASVGAGSFEYQVIYDDGA